MADIVKREQQNSVEGLLAQPEYKYQLQQMLGQQSQAFVTSVLSLVGMERSLQNVNPKSVVLAAMTAATMDLPVQKDLGYAYIYPYKSDAQFQIGAKGFVQLALRTGQYLRINAITVYEGEMTYYNRLTGDHDYGKPATSSKAVGFLAYFRLINGFEATLYMSVEDMVAHAKEYSQAYKKNFGPWKDNFNKMGEKTVLKLLLKRFGPLSVEMQRALRTDQGVVNDWDLDNPTSVSYVDNDVIDVEQSSELQNRLAECEKLATELNGKIEEAYRKADIKTLKSANIWRDRLKLVADLYAQNLEARADKEAKDSFKTDYAVQELGGLVEWLQVQLEQTIDPLKLAGELSEKAANNDALLARIVNAGNQKDVATLLKIRQELDAA